MKVLAISNGTGSRLWRIDPYLKYLDRQGMMSFHHPPDRNVDPVELAWADVVIVEMILEKRIIDMAHAMGTVVIYEVDDLIEKVTKNHPNYIQLTRAMTMYRTYNCIRKSDAVFCSTENIKKRYGWINGDAQIWPNLLDMEYWEKPYRPNTSKEIRLGWAGSFAHYDDLKLIQPVIKAILKKYPNVKFVYVGMGGVWHGSAFAKFNWGEDIFNEIPPNRREFHHGVTADLWAEKLAGLRLDIGIAPIVDNKFSRAKSNIKWQEYAINRIPGVFSPALYGDTVRNKIDGFLAETQEQWIEYLSALIEGAQLRKRIAESAYNRAKTEFDIEPQLKKWTASVMKIHGDLQPKYKNNKDSIIRQVAEQYKSNGGSRPIVIDK